MLGSDYGNFSAVYLLNERLSTTPRGMRTDFSAGGGAAFLGGGGSARDQIQRARPMTVPPAVPPGKSIVLVGLMGAGKTSVGRRLAKRLNLPFVDADAEIAQAAGCSVEDIFEIFGEAAFRDGELRVTTRLLDGETMVLATGGGAFMTPRIRSSIRKRGISVWLRADIDTLVRRTGRRDNRPLLKGCDTRAALADLMKERYPVYAQADIVIDSGDDPPGAVADRILAALGEDRGSARKTGEGGA